MLPELSHHSRTAALASLPSQAPFDLLIIGGGITGAGAARDAALRGYRVALVEKGDFASGTSSKSTKLVHGGLRYLELFEFGLVFEALQERRVLLKQARHLVRPRSILFPIYRGAANGLLKLSAGMWLYDGLSLFRNVRRHRLLLGSALRARAPGLRGEHLEGAAHFYDAQTHDARLTLANAQQAHAAGATLLPYTEVMGFLRERGREGEREREEEGNSQFAMTETPPSSHELPPVPTSSQKPISGVQVRDVFTDEIYEVRARLVLNCTGPWTDWVVGLAEPGAAGRLRPTKGAHLVFPKARLPLEDALMVSSPEDGRLVFIVPWQDATIVGTTDTDYTGDPDNVPVTEEDVRYLLAVANHAFPEAGLTRADVQSSWAGLRPLLQDEGAASEGATSREHAIWEQPEGLVNIAGGKLTTYRVMARQLVDVAAAKVAERAGIPAKTGTDTALLPLPGAEQPMAETNPTTLPDDVWAHLAEYYGTRAFHVAARVAREPGLGARIVVGLPYIWAELPHAVECELCLTVDDFLARRTWLIYEAPQRGAEVLDEVIGRMALLLGWDAARCEAERARYQHQLSLLVGG